MGNPIRLFLELYKLLEPIYGVVSNSIYTEPDVRIRFDRLSDFFLTRFREIDVNELNYKLLGEINEAFENENDGNFLCLSLFKGVTEYLPRYKRGTLKLLEPMKVGGFIVTPRPPNPIYDALPNPAREYYGTGIHDFTDIFSYISVVEETKFKINLVRNERLKSTCRCLKRRVKGGLKIAVTPFMQDIVFDFDSLRDDWPVNDKTPYWFRRVENIVKAKKQLVEKILEPCLNKEVDILVLPELSIDSDLLFFLKEWLKLNNRERVSSGKSGLLMVVAGSFHFGGKTDGRYNTSTILDHTGNVLWTQNKLKRFSFNKKDLRKNPGLRMLLRTSEAGGYENIDETDTVYCADTPVGRISVCICLDFFHKNHIEGFRKAGINVFLVPAMTPQNIRFLEIAGTAAEDNLAASFFSNSGYAAKKEKSGIHAEGASFYFLPRTREKGTLATGKNKQLLIFDFGELIKS